MGMFDKPTRDKVESNGDSKQGARTDRDQSPISTERAQRKADRAEFSTTPGAQGKPHRGEPLIARDNMQGAPGRVGSSNANDDTQGRSDSVGSDDRRRRIAEAAYYRAQQRRFSPGNEDADWLLAEQEIDRAEPQPQPQGK